LATEPLRGGRTVTVGERRTRLDFAACVNELVDGHYPEVEQLLLALDQLTTHSPAARSAAFPAAVAKRHADKLEIHHTPTHGSWLNMAAIEVSALERQCLRQRLADRDAGGAGDQRLAVHDRRCPHRAPPALSGVCGLTHH